MTKIYRSNKLGVKELEKVVGGGFKDCIRDFGCLAGFCDNTGLIKVEKKFSADGKYEYTKLRCSRCGRLQYFRHFHETANSGYVDGISEQEYNAVRGDNVLVI